MPRQERRCTPQLADGSHGEAIAAMTGGNRAKETRTLCPADPPGGCLSRQTTKVRKQLRGINKVRKSFVLALVLVMAVASASLAATPSFSGNLKLTAESDGSFTGPFTLTPEARVDVNFAEKGDNWSLDARLRATWNGKDDVTFGIHRYKGVLQAGSVTAMAWRNYEEKNIDTPFRWVRLAGEPGEKVDALRLSADVSGVQIDAQLQNN